MKKVITLLAVLTILAVQLCSCYYPAPETNEKDDTETDTVPDDTELKEPTEEFIIIPDISGLDEETAKNLLARKGLIPRIERAYNDFVAENRVVSTYPEIGSSVKEDDVITVTISKGPRYFEFENALATFWNIQGIDGFSWGDDGKEKTKAFWDAWFEEGYIYFKGYLCCKSEFDLAFHGTWCTASINDSFDKTVPGELIYDSKTVDNTGKVTWFTVKIPVSDLSVKKPTNIYVKFDFDVNGTRQTFKSSYDITWPAVD